MMDNPNRRPKDGTVVTDASPAPGTAPTVSLPQDGDVLITRRTAAVMYDVVIMPDDKCVTRARHDLAITVGRETAQQLRVDLWITEDHIHFWRLAAYRDISGRLD